MTEYLEELHGILQMVRRAHETLGSLDGHLNLSGLQKEPQALLPGFGTVGLPGELQGLRVLSHIEEAGAYLGIVLELIEDDQGGLKETLLEEPLGNPGHLAVILSLYELL